MGPTRYTRLRYMTAPITEGTPGTGTPAPTPTPPTGTPPAGFVSQEKANEIAAEQKARGEREAKKAAEDALAAKLGDGVTLDDLLAAHAAQRAADDAAKTEAQRELDAAKADRAAAAAEKAETAKIHHQTLVNAALTTAGAPTAAQAAINVDVAIGATAEEIKAAVDKLKTDLPALFTAQSAPPEGDPGKGPNRKPPAGEPFGSGGLSEFEKRYPTKTA